MTTHMSTLMCIMWVPDMNDYERRTVQFDMCGWSVHTIHRKNRLHWQVTCYCVWKETKPDNDNYNTVTKHRKYTYFFYAGLNCRGGVREDWSCLLFENGQHMLQVASIILASWHVGHILGLDAWDNWNQVNGLPGKTKRGSQIDRTFAKIIIQPELSCK
jgi:hypothetical protein